MKPDPGRALQQGWEDRQESLGDSPRAVLMKGVPDVVNLTIDRWHRRVLRAAFGGTHALSGRVLDIGCGYGRLADEMASMGAQQVVGLDFSPAFCRHFARRHGPAACGDLLHLPFAPTTFTAAYAVTCLMYLDAMQTREALRRLDECLVSGARVLLLEPGAEFNSLVRSLPGRRQRDRLARPGFTLEQFARQLAPSHWRPVASGSNTGMTVLFPLLLLCTRWSSLYSLVERLALRLDRPRASRKAAGGRYAIYRWTVYECVAGGPGGDLRNTQT